MDVKLDDVKVDETKVEEVVQASQKMLADEDPAEVAAMLINQFSQKYKEAIYVLSTGQARRLNIALCTYPFENEHIMDADPTLMQTYALGCRLIEAKMLLLNEHAYNQFQKQQKEKEEKEVTENGV